MDSFFLRAVNLCNLLTSLPPSHSSHSFICLHFRYHLHISVVHLHISVVRVHISVVHFLHLHCTLYISVIFAVFTGHSSTGTIHTFKHNLLIALYIMLKAHTHYLYVCKFCTCCFLNFWLDA